MSLPKNVAVLVKDLDPKELGASTFADKGGCEGARFHSPTPLVLYEVKVGKRKVLLCGACRDNLAVLSNLHNIHDGALPWNVRREFGNQIRALHGEMIGG